MKILHLAAGNRWTGAAAPAFAEVEALREAGVDAHFAYVGGYKLQQKLSHRDFAHPLIDKAQNPMSFARAVAALDRMILHHGFDFLHAHLTYDHWLARFAVRGHEVRLARTFHSRRTLRNDPFTQSLVRRTDVICVVNETFRNAPLIASREPVFTPPPIDTRQFKPGGENVRSRYGIAPDARVVIAIGKLSKDRGFEDALRAFSVLQRTVSNLRMMIIGHGPHRPALEELSRDLGIADAVTWAGYHEDDLAEHYRAGNALFFTAAGSDEGHRAVLEAMACGVPPVSYPLPGIAALMGALAPRLVARTSSPDVLAQCASDVLRATDLREPVIAQSDFFVDSRAAERLLHAYTS